jgi:hypothetical protein
MPTSPRSREPVERRERLARASAARAERDRRTGLRVIAVGVAIFVVWFVVISVLWLQGHDVSNLSGWSTFVVAPVTLAVIVRGRRMRVRGAERALAEDERAPIVYLRPFDADSAEIATRWSSRQRISPFGGVEKTYEERLARSLREVGPFVAIGDPTERLPQLGAARLYAADEEWQRNVDDLTARAGVILLHAGESQGLAWEVRHVIALDAPERLILSLPLLAKRKQPSREERYDAFRQRFGDAFPRPLPGSIGHSQFVYFEPDWTARLLGARGGQPPAGDTPRSRALGRLMRDFKVVWAPLWARTVVYGVVIFVSLGVVGVLTD